MSSDQRTVYFISDSTGITVEMLGQSILSQFSQFKFLTITVPFVDNEEKARAAATAIDQSASESGTRPLVMSTLVDPEQIAIISKTNALFLDCLGMFVLPLEKELGVLSTHTVGLSHAADDVKEYFDRMEAVNFTLTHDDGLGVNDITPADVILVGVSRSGKTPTSLYMALQFGIRVANYPLTPDDLDKSELPEFLLECKPKLFGLTIDPLRLHQIRESRRAGSNYSSLENCRSEVLKAEKLMKQTGVPTFNTTTRSIEELSVMIMQRANLKRHLY